MNHSGECMIWEQQPAGDDGWHDCTCHVFYSNESSAHDPICPQATIYSGEWEPDQRHWSCHCDIIAKVRADERRQAVERVRAEKGKFPSTRLDWDTIVIAVLDGTKLRLSKKELNEQS